MNKFGESEMEEIVLHAQSVQLDRLAVKKLVHSEQQAYIRYKQADMNRYNPAVDPLNIDSVTTKARAPGTVSSPAGASSGNQFHPQVKPVYSCRRCKETFPTKRDQTLHKRENHEHTHSSYECKLCSKFFCNNGNLERHMKVHNDIRPYMCEICQKAFTQAVNLQRHYSVHNGERPYQCSFCTKAFTQQSNMRRHELTHTGEKPFGCKRCNRFFSQRINLKKHIMGHLNSRPYMCGICQKTFIQSANYKKHIKVHIKEGRFPSEEAAQEAMTDIKPNPAADPITFECAICHSVFDNFSSFESHESSCDGVAAKDVHLQNSRNSLIALGHYTPLHYTVTHLEDNEIIVQTGR